MKKIFLLKILVVLLTITSCKTEKKEVKIQDLKSINYLDESKEDFNERIEWWRNARFGMFIHWGVYSIPAGTHAGKEIGGLGEWIMNNAKIPVAEYEQYTKQFNPKEFDAVLWAKTMKKAGMKYVVITSKHHDGFALWDSKVSDYDVIDFSPYGKDILKQLSDACKKEGIKFGLYHSIIDWHHPEANYNEFLRAKKDTIGYKPKFANYLKNYLKPQLKELIDNYDPEILWFDGEWTREFNHEQGLDLYQYVRSLKPSIIINNRVDKGRKGHQGMNRNDGVKYAGDFGTPEQQILETASTLDWESCMTMNKSWGFKSNDDNWKSSELLIHNLIDVVAKGGNFLLNVGPTSTGLIPGESIERLQEIGNWLDINGEAIYNTERLENKYKQGDNIRFTKKKNSHIIYSIILKKTENKINLKGIKPNKNSSISILGFNTELEWSYNSENGLDINIPNSILDTWNDKTYALTIKIKGEEKLK